MRFDKVTRKRIYAARGKPVDIRWPMPSEPRVNGRYSIQANSSAGEYQLRVLSYRRQPDGFMARVKLEGDPVRLLAKKAGYTEHSARAMDVEEPEAVDSATQRRLTEEAKQRDELGRIVANAERESQPLVERLRSVLDQAGQSGRDVSHQVMFIQRRRRAKGESLRADDPFLERRVAAMERNVARDAAHFLPGHRRAR